MTITLYSAPMSSALPVEHALAELDVAFELIRFDFSKGEQREASYLAINPNGKVPALVVDGTPVFEALAILIWLGDRYGVERGLWPRAADPKRLEAISWSTWAYVSLGAEIGRFRAAGAPDGDPKLRHEATAKQAAANFSQLLTVLEARLAHAPYLLGEEFSLADLIVASPTTYGTFVGLSADGFPNVQAWLARFQERPAFRKTWA